ncbi:X-ray radiation resistance-associated protein 1 isoform X7 [Cervus elaphus]|uniref:X-ray radiation resistance-associated protein 1 isoform X7 n=1 Tax=Cervus canadensis TaxID=1574408 RepID=UPI001C9E8505|nr:X-ray radiation resistance-associated protein 1 isoform X7 [Cervus canadensis]XP_043763078.1 X-ray radiation resistance-associated protein 1 isoform X7 [Cervus elaphus]
MASTGLYKLDDGKPHLSNCFPAKNLLRTPEEAGRGHWLVARKGSLKKKPKNATETTAEGQKGQKVSFEVGGKKGSRQENRADTPGHVLDQAFLLKHHCVKDPSDLCNVNVSGLKFSKAKEKDFKHFNSVIYINASENLLPLEAFHTFPILKELELAFNGIKTVYVKYGDFKSLEIAKEDAILPVALFPSLCELIFHNNPLVTHTRGVPPLLKSFLQERLGIHLIRRKIVKAKHHILMPRKDSRKVKNQVPKVPKQPMILPHPSLMIKSPSKEMLESEAELTKEPPATKTISVEREMPIEGLGGLPMPHRTFVPLPPICSNSTVHSEETSHRSDAAGRLSPDHLSDEDTKSTESIFLTQVSGLSSSIFRRDDSETKEKDQRPPSTAPREAKSTQKPPSASCPRKYHGYEELLTAKPDPTFIEPKGIQKNAQALQHMLKHPLVYRSSKPRLDTLQKHYVPKEKRTQRIPIPPPRKTRAQLLDDILIRMRDTQNITEAPLGAVLRQRTERRLVNQKQFLEAKKLLKEFRARYRRLVRCSLRSVFGTTAPPQARPALSGSQPKLGHFLEFMDEFYQEPTASDLKG